MDAGLLILVASMSMGMVADALGADIQFSAMSDAVSITAYSSIMLGASICGMGSLRTNLFPKWLSGIFTIASGLSFLLLATAEPVDLDTNELLIPAFMSVHLVMIILGIYTIRRHD